MSCKNLVRRVGAGTIMLFLCPPLTHADGGCAGYVTSVGGNIWSVQRELHVPTGHCVRVSEDVKTKADGFGLIHVNGFVELVINGATQVKFDEHYAGPSDSAHSVLSVVLVAGSLRYASGLFSPMRPRREQLLQHVTGIRVRACEVKAKYKLGQNESDVDLPAILRSLDAERRIELVARMQEANQQRLMEAATKVTGE